MWLQQSSLCGPILLVILILSILRSFLPVILTPTQKGKQCHPVPQKDAEGAQRGHGQQVVEAGSSLPPLHLLPGTPPRGCERASQSQPQVSAAPGVGVHPHITAAQGCRALSLHCTKALGP